MREEKRSTVSVSTTFLVGTRNCSAARRQVDEPGRADLTDVCDGFLRDGYYVLHDRDPLFTAQFRDTLAAGGATAVRLPAKSPDLNAHAERFVRSIKEECINRVVPLGERHLRTVVRQFMIHIMRRGTTNRWITS